MTGCLNSDNLETQAAGGVGVESPRAPDARHADGRECETSGHVAGCLFTVEHGRVAESWGAHTPALVPDSV